MPGQEDAVPGHSPTAPVPFPLLFPAMGNFRELGHPRGHYISFSFGGIWITDSEMTGKELPPHISLPQESLQDLLSAEF